MKTRGQELFENGWRQVSSKYKRVALLPPKGKSLADLVREIDERVSDADRERFMTTLREFWRYYCGPSQTLDDVDWAQFQAAARGHPDKHTIYRP